MNNYTDQTPKDRCWNCVHPMVFDGDGMPTLRCLKNYKHSAQELGAILEDATDCSWVVKYDEAEQRMDLIVAHDGICDDFEEEKS